MLHAIRFVKSNNITLITKIRGYLADTIHGETRQNNGKYAISIVRLRSARAEIGLHKCADLSGHSLSSYCAYINATLVHVQVSKGNSQTRCKRNVHLFE